MLVKITKDIYYSDNVTMLTISVHVTIDIYYGNHMITTVTRVKLTVSFLCCSIHWCKH